MKVVILAAGRGSRMGRLTGNIPKSLIALNGKSIIEWTLLHLPKCITECVIVVGYKGELIREKIGSQFCGCKITYVYQNSSLMGTGEALALAKPFLVEHERFLVIMGDDLYNQKDLTRLVQTAPSYGVCRLVKTSPIEQSVLFTKAGRLVALRGEIPQHYRYVGVGAYCLNESYFQQRLVRLQNGEYSLPHTVAQMQGVRVRQFKQWYQINTPEHLESASRYMLRRY